MSFFFYSDAIANIIYFTKVRAVVKRASKSIGIVQLERFNSNIYFVNRPKVDNNLAIKFPSRKEKRIVRAIATFCYS